MKHTNPAALLNGFVNILLPPLMVLSGIFGISDAVSAEETIVFQTDTFSLHVNAAGLITCLMDRCTNTNYVRQESPGSFAVIKGASEAYFPKSAQYDGKELLIDFGDVAGKVVFNVASERRRLEFEIASLTWEDAEELVFAGVPLTLKGDLSEPFGVSPLALNLQTNCHSIPGLNSSLSGFIAYKRFGFVGARGAIIACPVNEMRDALKEAVKSTADLVCSPLGGPWALDAEINHGSYLIAMEEDVTEDNVSGWIDAARQIGATQIDLHGGHAFRWGDYEVNREVYPLGRDSLKAVVDAIHDAGMHAGLHSYAFYIDKNTPWVTPVPDPRLDYSTTFTLAENGSNTDTTILVRESTEQVSALTGFQVRNSATLRIDDELITFSSAAKEPPYAFHGCVRGAHGTRAAGHKKDAQVRQLKECFGLFVPQGDSSLFAEVAQRTADLYNYCGFDMLYLDALDGADILAGGEWAWHYAGKFVYELMRRLEKPPVMEMSTFTHHLWCARSRMGAWDCPMRGKKDFIDLHVLSNRQWEAAFLPVHLGWWGIFKWDGIQPERTLSDELEYLYVKALATNSSVSYIAGVTPESLKTERIKKLVAVAQRYEEMRRDTSVTDSIRQQLVFPGAEFTLVKGDDGQQQFRQIMYSSMTIAAGEEAAAWTVQNPFAQQPLQFRIEALPALASYDAATARVLVDWKDANVLPLMATQEGVSATLSQDARVPETGERAAVMEVHNGDVEPHRAWATVAREFDIPLDLAHKGLGVWVEGDGQGAVLNLQLRSPLHLAGGFVDRYVLLDFTGWRYVELVEPESEALAHYEWEHTRRKKDWLENPALVGMHMYPMYHIWTNFGNIAKLTVGVNNVPQGKSVRVGLGPVKALPLVEADITNPSINVNGETISFPVTLESGSYLELRTTDGCRGYDAQGCPLTDCAPVGNMPLLQPGNNECGLAQASNGNPVSRARFTLILTGEAVQ